MPRSVKLHVYRDFSGMTQPEFSTTRRGRALDLFRDAAEREAATVELARQVLSFLFRSQHDPALSFAAWTTASRSAT